VAYSARENEAGLITRRYRQLGFQVQVPRFARVWKPALCLLSQEAKRRVFTSSPTLAGESGAGDRRLFRGEVTSSVYARILTCSLRRLTTPSRFSARRSNGPAPSPKRCERRWLHYHELGAGGEFHFDAEGNGRHDMNIVVIHGSRHQVLEVLGASALQKHRQTATGQRATGGRLGAGCHRDAALSRKACRLEAYTR